MASNEGPTIDLPEQGQLIENHDSGQPSGVGVLPANQRSTVGIYPNILWLPQSIVNGTQSEVSPVGENLHPSRQLGDEIESLVLATSPNTAASDGHAMNRYRNTIDIYLHAMRNLLQKTANFENNKEIALATRRRALERGDRR